jgi:hypothetical protein
VFIRYLRADWSGWLWSEHNISGRRWLDRGALKQEATHVQNFVLLRSDCGAP